MNAVNPLEIAAGKWAALAGQVAAGGTLRRELMRHVHDLAVLHPSLLDHRDLDQLAPMLFATHELPKENVGLLLELLRAHSDRSRARYESYLDDMGTERIGEGPPWIIFPGTPRSIALSKAPMPPGSFPAPVPRSAEPQGARHSQWTGGADDAIE